MSSLCQLSPYCSKFSLYGPMDKPSTCRTRGNNWGLAGTISHDVNTCAMMLGMSKEKGSEFLPMVSQVINTYGDLSNSELLRRYGFVETEPNPHDCIEVAFLDLHRSCLSWRGRAATNGQASTSEPQIPSAIASRKKSSPRPGSEGSSSTDRHRHRNDRHKAGENGHKREHAQCGTLCAAHTKASRKRECSGGVGCGRATFLAEQSLVPPDGWFKVDRRGRPPAELLEAARLLLLPDQEFAAFVRRVEQWRPPQVRPLSWPTASDVPGGFLDFMQKFSADIVQRCEHKHDVEVQTCSRTSVSGSAGLSAEEMVATVLRGELQCACKFKEYLDMQTAEGLMKHCSLVWRHIRARVKQ
jgi:hypothetical protein